MRKCAAKGCGTSFDPGKGTGTSNRKYCYVCVPRDMTHAARVRFYEKQTERLAVATTSRRTEDKRFLTREELDAVLDQAGVNNRLRCEAAKPLLRLAIMHKSWALVDAALDELESDPKVIDIRALVAMPEEYAHAD
jgi:hypothetical protein